MAPADPLLDDGALAAALGELPSWSMRDGALHRELVFRDFTTAFAFMTELAAVAERLDHHPDWCNSWNKVTLDVISHAAAGITERCVALATATDEIAARHR